MLSYVACSAVQYFSTLSQKVCDLKNIERKRCVSIFSTTSSETFLILTRNERAMIKDVCGTSCEVPATGVAQLIEALRYKPEGRGFDS